jgi:hypothetical protein
LANEVVLRINVFTVIVEDRVLTEHDCGLVVDLQVECSWFLTPELYQEPSQQHTLADCCCCGDIQPVRSAYQPPASSTFFSEQISHQQSASSTFLSEQISTNHQPPAKRTD